MTGASSTPDELSTIKSTRLEHLEPVTQPLCLISQLPRSGGTLLLHLFDGHPACHVVPHEYGGEVTAQLDSLTPEEAFEKLYPKALGKMFRKGLGVAQRKNGDNPTVARDVPLSIVPSLQREIFLDRYPEDFSPRAVFDAYFTSYFNAWIDNQNLYETVYGDKSWVVAFEPRVILKKRHRDRLEALYPDGRVISIVREPQAWFASARGWSMEWASVRPAMELWAEGTEELLRVKEELGDRHAIVLFSDLVRRPEDTMRDLLKWLRIDQADECRTPTVNGRPIAPNTSFTMDTKKVSPQPLKRGATLSDSERAEIDRLAGDLIERVTTVALGVA